MEEFIATLKKYQHDIYFVVIGITIAVLLIGFFVSSLGFVAVEIGRSLESGSTMSSAVQFNLDKLQQLPIGAPSSTASTTSSSDQTP
jgi:hypothetical protein